MKGVGLEKGPPSAELTDETKMMTLCCRPCGEPVDWSTSDCSETTEIRLIGLSRNVPCRDRHSDRMGVIDRLHKRL